MRKGLVNKSGAGGESAGDVWSKIRGSSKKQGWGKGNRILFHRCGGDNHQVNGLKSKSKLRKGGGKKEPRIQLNPKNS